MIIIITSTILVILPIQQFLDRRNWDYLLSFVNFQCKTFKLVSCKIFSPSIRESDCAVLCIVDLEVYSLFYSNKSLYICILKIEKDNRVPENWRMEYVIFMCFCFLPHFPRVYKDVY